MADALNDRILFLSPAGTTIGQIGTNGVAVHDPPTGVGYPNGDTPLTDGNVLVSEINGSWITEYTPAGKLVWTVHLPTVNYPSDPQQIGTNLYLLADYDPPAEGRILTITRSGTIMWNYDVTSRRRHAQEAVPGRTAPQRAHHGQRRLPQQGRGHRPAL